MERPVLGDLNENSSHQSPPPSPPSSPFQVTPKKTKPSTKKSSLEDLKKSSRVKNSIFQEQSSRSPVSKIPTKVGVQRQDSRGSVLVSHRLKGPRAQDAEENTRKSVQFDAEPHVRTFIPPTPDPSATPYQSPDIGAYSDSDNDETLPMIAAQSSVSATRPLPPVPAKHYANADLMTKDELQNAQKKTNIEEKVRLMMLDAESRGPSSLLGIHMDSSAATSRSASPVRGGSEPSSHVSAKQTSAPFEDSRGSQTKHAAEKVSSSQEAVDSFPNGEDADLRTPENNKITREDIRRRARERREAKVSAGESNEVKSHNDLRKDGPTQKLRVDTSFTSDKVLLPIRGLPARLNDDDEDAESIGEGADLEVISPSDMERRNRFSLLPEIESLSAGVSGGLGLKEYMTPSPPMPSRLLPRPVTPPSKPRDVLVASESPACVPSSIATVRVPGSNLKTRISLAPVDTEAMARTRRKVSGQASEPCPGSVSDETSDDGIQSLIDDFKPLDVDIGMPDPLNSMDDISLEFDRLLEAQTKGYVTRHHSRIVHATSSDPDLVRPSHSRGESWSVEPWKTSRRRSRARKSEGRRRSDSDRSSTKKPGFEGRSDNEVDSKPERSIVPDQTLSTLNEEASHDDKIDTTPCNAEVCAYGADPSHASRANEAQRKAQTSPTQAPQEMREPKQKKLQERGRLFVRVIAVKDLTLPIPQDRNNHFALTLDNGMHCVTTSWLQLAKDSAINQEFELVVVKDLEFILTLHAKVDDPGLNPSHRSTLSRIFSSPKKKAKEALPLPVNAFDGHVAADGSFARAYISLHSYERAAMGRSCSTTISCFNEWAVDIDNIKVKGKKTSSGHALRKPPYKIGNLELQLLFVPTPPETNPDALPKSMNSCIRQLKDAEWHTSLLIEGYLSQQGGDCPYWRRRYFQLVGPTLTAYHEATRQPRASINLGKATALLDDGDTNWDILSHAKAQDLTAFGEQEGGYMFLEEGFRIKFADGEAIDFYATNRSEKQKWIKVLGDTIGKVPKIHPWTQIVLSAEKDEQVQQK